MIIYKIDETSNTFAGALIVYGGVGIGGSVYVGSTMASTSQSAGSVVLSGGLGIGKNLYIGDTTLASGTTTGSVVVNGGINIGGNLLLRSTIDSTSYDTGAFNILGGCGIGKKLYINDATVASGTTVGAFVVSGGINIGNAIIRNTTLTVSATSGSLIVHGGIGVVGGMTMGNATSTSDTTGTLYITGGGGIKLPTTGSTPSMLNFYNTTTVSPFTWSYVQLSGTGVPPTTTTGTLTYIKCGLFGTLLYAIAIFSEFTFTGIPSDNTFRVESQTTVPADITPLTSCGISGAVRSTAANVTSNTPMSSAIALSGTSYTINIINPDGTGFTAPSDGTMNFMGFTLTYLV